MKTILFAFLGLLFSQFTLAQLKPGATTNIIRNPKIDPLIKMNLPTTTRQDYIAFYEQNGFSGREARYAQNVPNFVMPFADPKYVSMKVSPGHIAYITFNDEFGSPVIFWGDNANFYQRLGNMKIISIKVVPAGEVVLGFGGISTNIENNDCKRFFGVLKVKVLEKLANNEFIYCPVKIINKRIQNPEEPLNKEATIFNVPNLSSRNPLQNYVFSNNPVPEITTPVRFSATANIGDLFLVNYNAVLENRIYVEFEIDLHSAHKSGDTASDFSSNVKMNKKEYIRLPYAELGTFFNIGPFRAEGSPDNTVLASGGIYKDFLVHFIKQNPNP